MPNFPIDSFSVERVLQSARKGYVLLLRTEQNKNLVGKFNFHDARHSLAHEFKVSEEIRSSPNTKTSRIAPAIGLVDATFRGYRGTMLVQKYVAGREGGSFFDEMQRRLRSGRIGRGDYSLVVQTVGLDLLDAADRLARCDRVNTDIKPDNFIVDRTGRTVMIDLEACTKRHRPAKTYDPDYAAPEMVGRRPCDERASVYQIALSLRDVDAGHMGSVAPVAYGRFRYYLNESLRPKESRPGLSRAQECDFFLEALNNPRAEARARSIMADIAGS